MNVKISEKEFDEAMKVTAEINRGERVAKLNTLTEELEQIEFENTEHVEIKREQCEDCIEIECRTLYYAHIMEIAKLCEEYGVIFYFDVMNDTGRVVIH